MPALLKIKQCQHGLPLIISKRAKNNLAKQGLTIPEYIRLSLVKAANNEVRLVSFFRFF